MIDMTDPHVVLTGNPVDGFDLFGPTPLDDEDGRREARTRRLEDIGEEWWLAPLRPLEDLASIDGVDDSPADVEVPGTGTVHAGDTYLTIVAHDRPVAAFALAGIELIEAVDWLPSGRPDWANGSICDPVHGDTSFIQAAVTLLRSQNPHLHGGHVWPSHLHDEVQRALRDCARRGLVADWTQEPAGDSYAISLPDARVLALGTPQQAYAFLGVLHMMFSSATVLRPALPGPAAIRQIADDIVDLIRTDVAAGLVPDSIKATAELVRHRNLASYCAALDPAYDISAVPFSTISALWNQVDANIAQGRLLTDDGAPMPART